MSRISALRKGAVKKGAAKKTASAKAPAKKVTGVKKPVPRTAAGKAGARGGKTAGGAASASRARKLAPKPVAARSPEPAKPTGRAAPSPLPAEPLAIHEPDPVRRVAAPAPRQEPRYASLAESDLRRAPASQYMNATQLAYFRERLLEMQRELLEKADLTSEHLREHDVEPDPTDQATIEEEYALELRTRDRERKLLKKIEQALKRIDDGAYGYCEETGEMIGIPRLLARPTATLSVEAQARRELKQKLYGE